MVEHRWVERQVGTLLFSDPPLYGEKERNGFRTERVLQYRTLMVDQCNVDGTLRVVYGNHWSDWQDVPTVKEK